MKFRVISLHKLREEKLREKTAQKLAPQQAAEVCEVLESNKDPYKIQHKFFLNKRNCIVQ